MQHKYFPEIIFLLGVILCWNFLFLLFEWKLESALTLVFAVVPIYARAKFTELSPFKIIDQAEMIVAYATVIFLNKKFFNTPTNNLPKE